MKPSACRYDVGVNPATRDRSFPDPIAIVTRNHDRIAFGIDTADHADMSAAPPSHHGNRADLRTGYPLAVTRK